MKPGCRTVTTDTCVPISRLAECVTTASEAATAAGMQHYIVGHVGDGNFHIAYLVDPNKPERARDWPSSSTRSVVQRALDGGGHLQRRARRRPAQDGLPGRAKPAPVRST